MAKPYLLTYSNRRTQGPPESSHDTFQQARDAVQDWIESMGWVGNEMAILAGLEIHGPGGVEWSYRHRHRPAHSSDNS